MTHLTNGSHEMAVVNEEHSLLLDGVVELAPATDAKAFFDGLLDVVLAYVEECGGAAVLSMSYHCRNEEEG